MKSNVFTDAIGYQIFSLLERVVNSNEKVIG